MKQQTPESPPPKASDELKKKAVAGDFKVFETGALFGTSREIGIHHDGSLYRLKITRQGKLILNK